MKRTRNEMKTSASRWLAHVLCIGAFTVGLTVHGKLPITNGLILDLDATKSATTMSLNADNEVLQWRSAAADGTVFEDARVAIRSTAYPNSVFPTGLPYLTTENGLPAVVFDNAVDGTVTNSLLATTTPLKGRTFFIVTRPHRSYIQYGGAIFGTIFGYVSRLQRVSGANNQWNMVSFTGNRYDASWINGGKSTSDTVSFADAGGIVTPHVLAVRSDSVDKDLQIIGASYVATGNSANDSKYLYEKCTIHEFVVYDRALSDVEVAAVNAALMAKWGLGDAMCFWTGEGETTDISDPLNWSSGQIPGAGEVAYIFNTTVTATNGFTAARLELVGSTLMVTGSFTGGTALSNTSSLKSTVVVENVGAAVFDAALAGNIDLEKRGAGVLALAAGQHNTGATRILSGTITGMDATNMPPLVSYGLVAHIDASDSGTITEDGAGNVTEWRSKMADGLKFTTGAVAYPDAKFCTAPVWRSTDADGRPFVRFGTDRNNVYTGALMVASSPLRNGTLFFVNRQIMANAHGTIFGNLYNYTDRIMREQGYSYKWMQDQQAGMSRYDIRVNGEETLYFGETSGINNPQLLVVRRPSVVTNDGVLGVAWVQNGGPAQAVIQWDVIFGRFDLYEAVIFDRILDEEQIAAVSSWLMAKWKCPKKTSVTTDDLGTVVSPDSEVTVSANATLDAGSRTQRLPSLNGGGTLAASGTVDLDGGTLAVAEILGHPNIINSSASTATLAVGSDAATRLEALVTGDIDVEKRGTGVTTVIGSLNHAGATSLNGGTLKVDADTAFAAIDGLVVHLDATFPGTMTLDAEGHVLEWRSMTSGGQSFRGASEIYPDAPFHHASPFFFTNAQNLASVHFGYTVDNVRTGAFMQVTKPLTTRTLFFVQTQRYTYGMDNRTIFGNRYDYIGRIRRDNAQNYLWASVPSPGETLGDAWMNGRKAGDGNPYTFETSAHSKPNLLVARRTEDTTAEIIGGAWIRQGAAGANNDYNVVFGIMDLHELLIYDRALSDEEIMAVSGILMKKWNVPAQVDDIPVPANLLPTNSTIIVSGDAALDFDGASQQIGGLTVAASGQVIPVLSVLGTLDVTGAPLTFTGLSDKARGLFLDASDGITGQFGPVAGLADRQMVTKDATHANVSLRRFIIYFR